MVALVATLALYDANDGKEYGSSEQIDSAVRRLGARALGYGICHWTDAAHATLLGVYSET
jgi:hypothetical protein